MRDGEHVVEIFYGQYLAFSLFKPALLCHGLAFRAMEVPAGIVERDFLSAIGALPDAASWPFGAASYYVRDDFELGTRHLVDLQIVAYVLAEYVGHLEFAIIRSRHRSFPFRRERRFLSREDRADSRPMSDAFSKREGRSWWIEPTCVP